MHQELESPLVRESLLDPDQGQNRELLLEQEQEQESLLGRESLLDPDQEQEWEPLPAQEQGLQPALAGLLDLPVELEERLLPVLAEMC